MTKYEPKTTPMERKLMLQMQQELFPGPDVDVVRNVLIDLHTCEACLAEREAEVERLIAAIREAIAMLEPCGASGMLKAAVARYNEPITDDQVHRERELV